MTEIFISEIRMFPYSYWRGFPPENWAVCEGQRMYVSQHQVLFSLIGTTWGGDGYATFHVPNLLDSAPLGAGQGVGLSAYDLGMSGGVSDIALSTDEIPAHTHQGTMMMTEGTSTDPEGKYLALATNGVGLDSIKAYGSDLGSGSTEMDGETVEKAGWGHAHENSQPWLAINFCIALDGAYPWRD